MTASMVGRNSPAKSKRVSARKQEEGLAGVLAALLECFELYGFDSTGYSLKKTLQHWQSLQVLVSERTNHSAGAWMKVAKYKLAAFFAFHLEEGHELPECPFDPKKDHPSVLLGGRAYRWCRSVLSRSGGLAFSDEKRISFLTTILYSKKGMPRPNKKEIEVAVRKTVESLSTENPTGLRTIHEYLKHDDLPDGRRYRDVYPVRRLKFSTDHNHFVSGAFAKTKTDFYDTHPPNLKADLILQQLDRTVDELFPKETYSDPKTSPFVMADFFKPRFPSTSANYINSRDQAGAVGSVLELRDRVVGKWDKEEDGALIQEEWVKYSRGYRLRLRKPGLPGMQFVEKDEVLFGGEISSRIDASEEDEMEQSFPLVKGQYLHVRTRRLEDQATYLYKTVFGEALKDISDSPAVPVGLAEALKVRVITKGPPMLQTALKPLQQHCHDVLRKHRCFALVGEPISEGYILERMGAALKPGQKYMSGDYSDATNNVAPEASERICRRLCQNLSLPKFVEEMTVTNLCRHTLEKKVLMHIQNGKEVFRFENVPQVWGQLMGAIFSFIVLCILNAAVSRYAMEYADARLWTLADAPLAINGDDIIMKTTDLGQRLWREITSTIGLVPSIGKCYLSTTYLNMNSTSFRRGTDHPTNVLGRDGGKFQRIGPFHQIPYVNLGLMYGLKRSQGNGKSPVGDGRDGTIGSRAQDLMSSCPDELRATVWKKFLNRHWKELSTVHVPWYMPEWIGGLGLPSVRTPGQDIDDQPTYGPTDLDLRKAVSIILNFKKRSPMKPVVTATWKVHQWIMSRLPMKPFHVDGDQVSTQAFDRLYGLLAVESLLRCDLDQIFDPDPVTRSRMVLRHNERIWRDARPMVGFPRGGGGHTPLKRHELQPRHSSMYLPVFLV